MAPDELISLLNTFYLAAFIIGIGLVSARLYFRLYEYRRARWELPLLLPRDIILFSSFIISFGLIFAARYFDWEVSGQLWWTLATGTPPTVAVYTWAYYEYFRVERKSGDAKKVQSETSLPVQESKQRTD